MATGFKTGGRKQGTPNILTNDIRKQLIVIIADELERLPEHMEQLPPHIRLELLVKLMSYCLPKVESITGTYDSPTFSGWDYPDIN